MLQIGDLSIRMINDGITMIDPGGAFGLVPRVLWSRYFEPNAEHLIPMMEMCLLVQTGEHIIVIDTGMGHKFEDKLKKFWHLERPTGDLIDGLGRAGVTPEDVTLVINTHLHFDHCAGNTYFDEAGQLQPTFPNAEYVTQRREYEDAMRPNERTAATYVDANWQILTENGQMRLLDGDTEIVPGLWGVITRGHTPGHMSIRFESNGQQAAFLCDMASYAVHFERLGWMAAYDVEPLYTLATKREWQKWALESGAPVIFPHDPMRPMGTMTLNDKGKPELKPLDVAFV